MLAHVPPPLGFNDFCSRLAPYGSIKPIQNLKIMQKLCSLRDIYLFLPVFWSSFEYFFTEARHAGGSVEEDETEARAAGDVADNAFFASSAAIFLITFLLSMAFFCNARFAGSGARRGMSALLISVTLRTIFVKLTQAAEEAEASKRVLCTL